MRIVQLVLAGVGFFLATESAHAQVLENFDRFGTFSKLPLGPTSNPYQPYFEFWKSSSSINSVPTVYNGTETVSPSDHFLGIQYPGFGAITLSMGGLPIWVNDYRYAQVDFYDDGTRDYGLLFQVFDTDGRWWGIGVNNNVARGKYYFRTDQNAGNTGTIIQARRDGAAATGNWHRFVLTKRGEASVDGVPAATQLAGVGTAAIDTVRVQADWSKPANRLFFDNWQISHGGIDHVSPNAIYCTHADGSPIDESSRPLRKALDTQQHSYYVYNTDPTFSIEIRCPVDFSTFSASSQPIGGFVSPMAIKVQDGYGGWQNAAADFNAHMVFIRNNVTTQGPVFNRVWKDFDAETSSHLDLPGDAVPSYPFAAGSEAYISARLQPTTNGRQTKIYYYRYLLHDGLGGQTTFDWNPNCVQHPCG